MSNFTFTPIIPAEEIILITGVNGYIAAHVADQALAAGYCVRGTVRNLERAKWTSELFQKKYGRGRFELVKVEKIHEEGAFDEAIKGVSGIAHIALDKDLTGEPEPYISTTLAGARTLLASAKKEPKVKRVVFSSSTMGAVTPKPNLEFTVGTDTYNEEAISKAYKPPFTPDRATTVYSAAKALVEKEIFKWIAEERPPFSVNTVLPAANFGKSLSGEPQSTGTWAKMVYDGDYSMIQYIPPHHFIDVVDDAKLHLGALTHPEIEGERLFAAAAPYNWTTVLETLKKIYPKREFPEGLTGLGHDLSQLPKERALFVLKSQGVDGFKPLEQSLKETLDGVV